MGKYVIGIDGGGTGSKGIVADLLGNVLLRLKGGEMNYVGGEKEIVDRNITALFHDALAGRSVEDCAAICVGCAGVSNINARNNIEAIIKRLGFTCPLKITTDSHTAHAGALSAKEGIVVIAGTGAICLGRKKNDENIRVGGWGYLIDDEGSAYYIGHHILRAVVRAYDGRGENTVLSKLVFDKLGISKIEELIAWLYDDNRTKRDLAALAMLVEDAAKVRDEVAAQIEREAAKELAILCEPAVQFFGKSTTIALSGSVLQKNSRIRQYFIGEIQDAYPENFGMPQGITVQMSENEADYGAMLLALGMVTNS